MTSRMFRRILALIAIVAITSMSVGCETAVGVGLTVGAPYGPYGPYGPWGPGTVYIGGPVWR